jgi:DNA repair photolyase
MSAVKSRPAANPTNRFHDVGVTYEDGEGPPPANVKLIEDQSRSILAHNDSPDVGFSHSVNPYRGCLHACCYCFARPSHEYLDMGAGTDFDTKIVVKPHAAELLREAFDKPSWKGELVMFSGVTDCYQAVESQLELTKQCLEVCLEYRNPVAIITKSALIERDLDLIVELHKQAGVHLSMSIAWVDPKLARALEPWAPAPERRFKVIEKFAAAGVPVGVMCAPIMPGLNDDQMVRVLERAKAAGAQTAGWVLLRLPGAVATVFEERVREALPLAADKIMHLIRETRGGEKLYDPRWHKRGRGEGVYAQTIATMFETTVKRLGLNGGDDRYQPQQPTRFARPEKLKSQLSLF